MNEKPILGITMGDPAGIGPEITLKALANPNILSICRPVIIGDVAVLKKMADIIGFQRPFRAISSISEASFESGEVNVLEMNKVDIDTLSFGVVSKQAGEAAFRYVEKAIELALSGEIDATVTNPLNKEAIHLAGHDFPGHTEIYAELTNTKKYTMLLADRDLKVVHVSTHVSLREACDRVKKDRVLEVIRIADKACKDMGIESPKVGVAGLNPHSGENGLFGMEEIEEIIPAVEAAKEEGILADGPVPPDSLFSKARGGWYDIVVAMYHDQGHIPLKVSGFVYDKALNIWTAVEGVNITLGLPIIRTSVDHGTAFGKAGKGTADEKSLVNAIEYAVMFARGRKNRK